MRKLVTIGINTIRGFASPAFNFLIAVFGIKYFGKEDWGIVINILLWVYFILIVTSFGNKEFLIRKYSREPSKVNYHFFSSIISRSPLLLLNLFLFLFFSSHIAIICTILSILLYCYSSLDSLIIHHQKFGVQLISDIIGFLVILGVVFSLTEFNLTSIIYAYIVATFIKILILVIRLDIRTKPKIDFKFSFEDVLMYFPFFLITFSGWLANKIDIYLVTAYLEKPEVSEYQLLSSSFLMVNAGFAFFITPFSKHFYRLPFEKIKKIKTKIDLFIIPYLLITTVIIWFVMEKVMKLDISIDYYYLSAVKTLFPLLYFIDIMILNKENKEKKITILIIFGIIINLIFILLLINKFRLSGVLISTCISRFVLLIMYKLNTLKSK